MFKWKKHIVWGVVFVSVSAFVFSFVTVSFHQLEHLKDVVCYSKDTKHYHTQEHTDNCKEFTFFSYYKTSLPKFSIPSDYVVQKFFFYVVSYQNIEYSEIFNRGPPYNL